MTDAVLRDTSWNEYPNIVYLTLHTQGFGMVLPVLAGMPELSMLDLRGCNLSDTTLPFLSEVLCNCK